MTSRFFGRHCLFFTCWLLSLTLLSGLKCGLAADAPKGSPPDTEAINFVRDLLKQRPAKAFALSGVFHLRQSDGRRSDIPIQYAVQSEAESWKSIYKAQGTSQIGAEQLVVNHLPDQANAYHFTQVSLDGTATNTTLLLGDQAAGLPFSKSDFWLTDLGMEFLHWPQQRFIRDAKITMKWGRPLRVVESVNPRPQPGRYSRVVSWIDSELGSLVKAEAYDLRGKRFKVFELRGFDKVNGRWEVREMEIRNEETDTRTRLEFHFDPE
ncbi:MAG: outer membrane lipoprotein-sorting protein [Verrucomicrobiota bacterium]